MSHPRRRAIRDDQGFTLVEILVVILIIGILAAIAIPLLLSQKGKAYDTVAKEMAHNGEVAAETFATEHEGKYETTSPPVKLTVAALHEDDSAIRTTEGKGNAYLSVAEAQESGNGYMLTVVAPGPGQDTFTIVRKENGEIIRTCEAKGSNKGGCETGSW